MTTRPASHLLRTLYRTDATVEEPGYIGTFSDSIPDNGGWQIVNVDWSVRGWVEVTVLIPGPHDGNGNVPYPQESDIHARQ